MNLTTTSKIRSFRLPNVWPVVQRELREGSRRPANRRLRLTSASVGTLLVWMVTSQWRVPTAQLGGFLLSYLHTFLIFLIFLIVPSLTADCVARERREGTLGLLFLTPLSANGIIAGKALAQGLRALTLWLAVLPILTIPFLTGGITWFAALNALSMEFCATVLCLGAGLLASSLTKERNVAFFLALALAAIFMFFFSLVSQFVIYFGWLSGRRQMGIINFGLSTLFTGFLNVVSAGRSNYRAMGSPNLARFLTFCLSGPLLTLVMFYFVGRFAAWRIDRSWQDKIPSARREGLIRRFCTPFLRHRFHRSAQRTLDWNPIAWLQQYSWKARLSKWGLCLLFVVIEVATFDSRNLEFSGLIQFALLLALAGIYTFDGVSGFLEEKRNGALELLLVTPISVNKLIFGRVWGLWRQFTPAGLVLVTFMVCSTWGQLNGDRFFEFLGQEFVVVCGFLTLPVFATYFALRVKNLIVAAVLTWIVVWCATGFALAATGLLSDSDYPLPPVVFLSFGSFALLTCFMLRHSLSRRIYSF